MAKSLKHHQEHLHGLASLGKDLARRSKRKCELCHQSGVSLSVFEVVHQSPPQLETCIFICDTCLSELRALPKLSSHHWRCLTHSLWSDIKIVQAVAIILLQRLNTDWSNDWLEQVYIDDEMNNFIIQVKKSLF
jgi:protein PhnA